MKDNVNTQDDADDINVDKTDQETKLVDWKNPPKLTDLKLNYTDAKPAHSNHVTNVNKWLDNLFVRNKTKVKSKTKGSQIVPKLIRKQAEWRYAALTEPFLSTDEIFNVTPVTWEDKKAAVQNQLILNNQFNVALDKTKFVDEYVRTAVDEGTVVVKVTWEFEEEEVEVERPVVTFTPNPGMAELHQQLQELSVRSPSEFMDLPDELKEAHQMTLESGVPYEAVGTGSEIVKEMKTLSNKPAIEICEFDSVILDPTAKGDIDKASFVIHRFTTSKAELAKDARYKNLKTINVTGNSPLNEEDSSVNKPVENFNFKDEPRKKIVAYEYWGKWDINKDGKLVSIVATWVGDTLIRMEENPFPDKKFPFVIVKYLPVRNSNYGEPDGELLEDNQAIIGAVTRGMIDIMGKSASGQTGMRKDMLDLTNLRKFERGDDYEFNPNVDPRTGVHHHVYPEIPQSAQYMINLQNMEAESLTGVKSFSNGVSGSSLGDVAAGVRGALDAASKRELGILRRLSAGVVSIGRKMISMNAEFLSDEEVVRITNDEFVTVRKEDLAGEFDLKLSISTAEEDTNKAQELAFMLQTLGPTSDAGMRNLILSDIAKLRKMPDLAKKIEEYVPQPDPVAEQMAQMQLALLQAQIATEQAKAAHYGSLAGLTGNKTNTESVKQGNIQADTDMKNLDFVEQESGVKQERALQQTGEQARSQAQLKVLDQETAREKNKLDLVKEAIKMQAKNSQ